MSHMMTMSSLIVLHPFLSDYRFVRILIYPFLYMNIDA